MNNLKRDELVKRCKERGLPVSGTKAVLIERLTGIPALSPKTKKTDQQYRSPKVLPAIAYAHQFIPVVYALRNSQGNFEHKDTHFVFDPLTHKVCGRRRENEVGPLNLADLEECREWGFTVDENKVSFDYGEDDQSLRQRFEELLEYFKNEQDLDDAESETEEDPV